MTMRTHNAPGSYQIVESDQESGSELRLEGRDRNHQLRDAPTTFIPHEARERVQNMALTDLRRVADVLKAMQRPAPGSRVNWAA
jgi:hypothetical protein